MLQTKESTARKMAPRVGATLSGAPQAPAAAAKQATMPVMARKAMPAIICEL